jgi:hypothetical protein
MMTSIPAALPSLSSPIAQITSEGEIASSSITLDITLSFIVSYNSPLTVGLNKLLK